MWKKCFLELASIEEYGGKCGSYREDDQCYPLKDCRRDIQNHLTAHHLSNDALEEYGLILARAGLFVTQGLGATARETNVPTYRAV